MPELPEVEITRRHLADTLIGSKMADVSVTHVRTTRHNSGPAEVESRLRGRTVLTVQRKGKFLRLGLDDGQTLVAHLGMSGRFSVNGPEEPHTHFTAVLDSGDVVSFIDPRTFGFVSIHTPDDMANSGVARLGPDAWLEPPSAAELLEALRGRTASIKALLLDQRLISGLGNIYADEALFAAGIHPESPGGVLGEEDLERLLDGIRSVLGHALENGGTSLDDLAYLLPDGRAGDNLQHLAVYGRHELPCVNCGTPIERIVVRGRSTHFCPVCQHG